MKNIFENGFRTMEQDEIMSVDGGMTLPRLPLVPERVLPGSDDVYKIVKTIEKIIDILN